MKDIIYYSIIGGLFLLNIVSLYRQRKKDNISYRIVLFTRHKDWLLAFGLVVAVISLLVLIEPYIPQFLRFGLFSLLDKGGTNANVEIIKQSSSISILLMLVVFAILMLLVPKAAMWEEEKFRYGITELKKSIFTNVKFGMLHCLVGVPIWIGIVLIFIGFAYTLKYLSTYKKYKDHDLAVWSSTSLHGKYNVILIVLLAIALITTT